MIRYSKTATYAFGAYLIGASAQAMAATYYIATTGSDSNPGTASAPFRTISYAYSRLAAGDTLIARPGTYYGCVDFNKNGTQASRITIKSEIRRGAILDGQNKCYSVIGLSGDYHTIEGFRITNAYWVGINMGGAIGDLIQYNEIDHNGVNVGHDGIFEDDRSHDNTYNANYIHHNGLSGGGSGMGHGMYIAGSGNAVLMNNIITDNKAYGIQLASYIDMSNLKLYHNVLAYNGIAGVVVWNAGGRRFSNVEIKNNIFYNNKSAIDFTQNPSGSGLVIDKNLSFGNPNGDVRGSGSISYTNRNWIHSNPLFVGAANFHLQSGSPAIGAGLTLSLVTTDHDGKPRPPYSIGAYEAGSTTSTPPPAPGNLARNPGFESQLSNWVNWGNNTLVTQGAYDGQYSLRTGTGAGGVGQPVPGVKPGSPFVMTVIAKVGSGDQGRVGIAFYNSYGAEIALAKT